MLEVRNVTKRFGNLVAVKDVSMSVKPGELRAIIGPNGAGKTTFFNMISGYFAPTAGSILFDGQDVTQVPAHRRVGLGMGRTFQITEIFPELTVHENVLTAAEVAAGQIMNMVPSRAAAKLANDVADEMLTLVGLTGKNDRPDRARHAGGLSTGRLHHGARPGQSAYRRDAEGDRGVGGGAGSLSWGNRMTAALTAEGLHTYYGKSHILHGVSLSVAEGKITALLGRNGAGKTTTLRSLMGLTPAREGKITIFGEDTTRWTTFRVAAAGVGYVPEGRRIFANLSVEENLKVPLEGGGPWTIERIYNLFPRLEERKSNRGRQLSGGEQEMLSIGRALLLNPRLLILDEPSQGLAPLVVREVFRIVAQMRQEGISVLLVEQNARMSLEIADHAYVLDDGIIVHSGPARELAADEARVQALAGASAQEWTET